MKLIDISFSYNQEIYSPDRALNSYKESNEYVNYLKKWVEVLVLKHINYVSKEEIGGVTYYFARGRNKFFYIPVAALRYLIREKPDVILIQGLVFPFQLLLVRVFMSGKRKIIVQHHGELPYTGLKRFFQKMADRVVNAYLFTSLGNAELWVKQGVINDIKKCFEVLEASTFFKQRNKEDCKLKLGIVGENNYLWVGRLDANKDPLTVLSGFEKYVLLDPEARLYMVYQTEDILCDVRRKIEGSTALKRSVMMMGKVDHDALETVYNACDYYLSASHKEGSGYAVLEAMACGCIPIVTAIPSFKKLTGDGKYGFLYEKGNSDDLYRVLVSLDRIDKQKFSRDIISYFEKELSFEKIAAGVYEVCKQLQPE